MWAAFLCLNQDLPTGRSQDFWISFELSWVAPTEHVGTYCFGCYKQVAPPGQRDVEGAIS